MNYVVAVSGGVDSVVLLDMLANIREVAQPSKHSSASWGTRESGAQRPESRDTPAQIVNADEYLPGSATAPHRLVVAHVDHGIREDSADDARFVEALAKGYGLPFVSIEFGLGKNASEEQARTARYAFLYEQAKKFNADIVTAHHQDDLIGSVAINLTRGTGWRGLAVMNRAGIRRPLLGWSKQQIYSYALKNRLEWVEDSTNSSDAYLRNRLRAKVTALKQKDASALVALRARQLQLVRDIDRETMRLVQAFGNRRHPYVQLDDIVAKELLRAFVHNTVQYRPSLREAERILLALKTARAGTTHDISNGLVVRCSRDEFFVENPR